MISGEIYLLYFFKLLYKKQKAILILFLTKKSTYKKFIFVGAFYLDLKEVTVISFNLTKP